MDRFFNPEKLSFDDAFINFKSDAKSSEVEKHFGIGPNISYEKIDDKNVKLNSYGSSISINLEKRTVEGMDVVFKDYTELLHAANMINFCGSAFRGICKDEHPFEITGY